MKDTFKKFNQLTVLIIGDVMIDAYLWGVVERISPEAPVPILSVNKKEKRLGGAANVALNIQAMGATPIICSFVGDDATGNELEQLLNIQNISAEGILKSKRRVTTVKTRIIGHSQQILRVDDETTQELSPNESKQLTEKIIKIMESKKIDAIIFEDYDKGVINQKLIENIITSAIKNNIPVVVDPKKKNFLNYKNATLFKPNLKELKEGLKLDFDHTNAVELTDAVNKLKAKINAKMVMVTLSEMGIYISNGKNYHLIPAHVRNISDVSGAGDTVVSVATLGLAAGLSSEQFTALANLAGGLVCEKVGVVPIDKWQLLEEAKKEGLHI